MLRGAVLCELSPFAHSTLLLRTHLVRRKQIRGRNKTDAVLIVVACAIWWNGASVCRRWTVMILLITCMVLILSAVLAGYLAPALLSYLPVFKVFASRLKKHSNDLHLLPSKSSMVFILKILHDPVAFIEVVSSRSSTPDSSAAVRSLTDISLAMKPLPFAEYVVTQHKDLDGTYAPYLSRSELVAANFGLSYASSDCLRYWPYPAWCRFSTCFLGGRYTTWLSAQGLPAELIGVWAITGKLFNIYKDRRLP